MLANGGTLTAAAEGVGGHRSDGSALVEGRLSALTLDRLVRRAEHAGPTVRVDLVEAA